METRADVSRRKIRVLRDYLREDFDADLTSIYLQEILAAEAELCEIDRRDQER